MKDLDTVVVVQSYSENTDCIKLFCALLQKYWSDCPYKIVIVGTGQDKMIDMPASAYTGGGCTLPSSLYSFAQNNRYQTYICFLPDAFISSMIDNKAVNKLLKLLKNKKINYCNITTGRNGKFGEEIIRKMSSKERYGHSYIAFIATKEFIKEEFCNEITDFEFERKYLKESAKKIKFFEDRAKLTANIFHIYHGIRKGKWNRHVYNKLKKENKELNFDFAPIENLMETIEYDIRGAICKILPNILIKKIKRILSRFPHIQFVIED